MKLTAGLIGCGRISHKHIEALINNSSKIDLIAVCDPVIENAKNKKSEYKNGNTSTKVNVFYDYKMMLNESKPDIAIIATESGYHPSIAIDSLESGCHVLTEKPMALSITDVDRMIESSKINNKKLGVCFQNRFNAPIQKTKKAIDQGRFGQLYHGQIQIRWNRNENYYIQAPWRGTWNLDGGTLMNQCTHGIDLLQWLMKSEVVRVQSAIRRFQRPIEAEDFGAAILEFANGSVGIIEGSANVYPKNLNETLSLFGEKGTVVIGGLAVNRIETWRFQDVDVYGDSEDNVINNDEKDPPTVYGFGHTALYADFLESIEKNRDPLISGTEGRKAVEIVLAIYKSMKERRPIEFPFQFSTDEMNNIFGE